ncbi:MAG TPA: ABC-2 family transporter protein [Chroococcidiopsis sp.]
MHLFLRQARTLLTVYYAYMLEYRAELLLWALSGSLPLIMMGVWVKAAETGKFGLSPVDFIRYFLAVFIVRQFNVVWVIWEFEREVLEGKLSLRLLQPIDPAWHHVTSHLSERVARLPFAIALMALFFLLYPQAVWLPSLGALAIAAVAIALAFALRFLMQYTSAMLAFWVERASATEQFWFLLYLFLSGVIAPLDIFPEPLRAIVLWTPFPYMVYFPASLLVGIPVNLVQGFTVLLGWTGIFFVINRWLWKKGLKHYSGMGA